MGKVNAWPQAFSKAELNRINNRQRIYDASSESKKYYLNKEYVDYYFYIHNKYKSNIVLIDEVFYGKYRQFEHGCLKHKICFLTKPSTVYNSKANSICPLCYIPSNKVSWKKYKRRLKKVHGNNIKSIYAPIQLCKPSLHECNKCGLEWKTRGKDLLKGHGCPVCSLEDSLKSKFVYYNYKHRVLKLQGYEFEALKLLEQEGVSINNIKFAQDSDKFVLNYIDNGIDRFHIPDFYIINTNTIVEVKSVYTLIITKEAYRLNKLKYLSAREQGYNYRLMLMSEKGHEIKLPIFMLIMSYKAIKNYLKGKR